MTVNGVRRSTLTLFSLPNCCHCHRTRLALLEKGIEADLVYVNPAQPPDELVELNPGLTLPTLVDRELVLYHDRVILDYLGERYPHPPLLAADPVSRARQRLALYRIEADLYTLLPRLSRASREDRDHARETLRNQIAASAPLFAAAPWFLGEEFSLLDCSLAPLLWRLPHYEIELRAEAAPVLTYAERLFARPAFRASLSPVEGEMRA